MSAFEEESCQRLGLVFVMFDSPSAKYVKMGWSNAIVANIIPIRLAACHFFLLDRTINPAARFLLGRFGKHYRSRTRIHIEEGTNE